MLTSVYQNNLKILIKIKKLNFLKLFLKYKNKNNIKVHLQKKKKKKKKGESSILLNFVYGRRTPSKLTIIQVDFSSPFQ
jgi:hypothetical protein